MTFPTRTVPVLIAAALLAGLPCPGGRCTPAAIAQDGGAPADGGDAQDADAPEIAGTEYHFGADPARTIVQFESETDLEVIHGKVSAMDGAARFDWDAGTGSCKLTVPVKEMRTGIDERDEHLRSETWLHAGKYPGITFESAKIVRDAEDDQKWTYTGKLTIRGVTKDLKGEARVVRLPDAARKALGPGQWVKLKTGFDVTITDFGVTIPNATVAAKVEETWHVTVDVFGTTEPRKRDERKK